ncbi:MAG: hypothetical protein K2M05_03015 [Paramuribaculum sp.]|nr:hypothetical protein [Paramuribaculum sp.]MDE6303295.1 hypothetical protein [Paramuribaculum sp.]
MAKIKIYGTLHNDTGESVVTASQICDTRNPKKPKWLFDTIDSMIMQPMRQDEIDYMIYDISHNYIGVPRSDEPWKGPWD